MVQRNTSLFTQWLLLLLMPAVVIVAGAGWNQARHTVNISTQPPQPYRGLFATADACISCHNGMVTPAGEDISFGSAWSATMMANSARDPYWHAAVRREILDHPESQVAIENECSTCHMPMAHFEAAYNGKTAGVFRHLPVNAGLSRANLLAADGVSCTTCHQITAENLGRPESFVGHLGLDTLTPMGQRPVFGPYPVDAGRLTIMHSSSGFIQKTSRHIQQSEVCATCHTLITKALGPRGEVIGELPEQVPYQEWKHSSFVDRQSCQSCHMPVVEAEVPIASVMGQPRPEVSRHTFQGGNFFMLRMLNRYRDELGVTATPAAMNAAADRTLRHLESETAALAWQDLAIVEGELRAGLRVQNRAGHKLPTAYPSRRVWIHFTVRDSGGTVLFESGAPQRGGAITGNDNDEDPSRFEPHYSEIHEQEQVQIYESILADPQGAVTTGLLQAVRFVKDNRILPEGFDKTTAGADIAVHGRARDDADFTGGGDRLIYRVDIGDGQGPFRVTAHLWYQPIAYRWARNLAPYTSEETTRFVEYYDAMAGETAAPLDSVTATVH